MALRDALRRPDVTETLHWKLRDYPRRVGARRENPTGFSRGSVNPTLSPACRTSNTGVISS